MGSKIRFIRGANHGATLAELLICTAIFGFLTFILLGVISFGTRAWRNVESRSSAQKEVRRTLLNVSQELRNTDIRTVSCGWGDTGNKVNWLAFATARNLDNYDAAAYDVYGAVTTGSRLDRIDWNYFVLYYLIPPAGDTCTIDNPTSSDYKCPHKILVRKYLKIDKGSAGDPNIREGSSLIKMSDYYLTASDVTPYLTQTETVTQVNSGVEKAVDKTKGNSVEVVARNLLVFSANWYCPDVYGESPPLVGAPRGTIATPPNYARVQFTVKAFKIHEYKDTGAIGANNLNILPATFSMQADQEVIPEHNYYDIRSED